MAEIRIKAEPRTEFGKGAARRVRRQAKVPAVLYGHRADPQHLSLPGHDLMLALKNPNALLSIDVEGGTRQLALTKQVQRDPIKGSIEHADLLVVRSGEKVTVDIRVVLIGEAAPNTLVVTETAQLSVEAEATHLPDSVEVSIDDLQVGTQIHAGDLELPAGTTLAVESDILVVNIVAAPTAADVEAELAEAESEVDIERDEADDHDEAGTGTGGESDSEADSDAFAGDE